MKYTLHRLTQAQLADLAAQQVPAGMAGRANEGALPPAFVARRALGRIGEGKSAFWCSTFLIVRDVDGQIVGGCGFKDEPRGGRVEIAYGVAPSHRREGAAAAAVTALLDLAFANGAEAVFAEIYLDNVASARLVQKLGFRDTGTRLDEDGLTVGVWVAAKGEGK